MSIRKLLLVPMLIAVFLLFPATTSVLVEPVHAGGVGVFATELTQLLNHIELLIQNETQVQQLASQLQQLETQIQQYQNMVQNTVSIPNQVFSDLNADMNSLATVVNNGAGLAYSMQNLDQRFQSAYPTYNPGAGSTTTFPTQYQAWSNSTLSTIQNTLAGIGLRGNQLSSEQSVLNSLKQMSQSNSGALQAAQTGNQIAVEMVAQLEKLQSLILMDLQSKQAFYANQTQAATSQQQILNDTFQPINVVGTGKTY